MLEGMIGSYSTIAIIIFIVCGFFTMLEGKNSDMWKPFYYSILWLPIIIKNIIKDGYKGYKQLWP